MTRIDRYINDVMSRIYASNDRKMQFESDLRNHFEEAISSGESEVEVLRKMGDPIDIAKEFMEEVHLVYANFFERLFAHLVDISACFSITIPLFMLFLFGPNMYIESYSIPGLIEAILNTGMEVDTIYMSTPRFILMFTFIFSLWGITFLYFPLLEYRYGKTLGKYLFNIKVLDETGGDIGMGAAFIRRLSYYFDILVIDAIFQPFSKKRQRAFDMVAKTIVIRETDKRITPLGLIAILAILLFPVYLSITFIVVALSM